MINDSLKNLTFEPHTDTETLLEATVRTAFALSLVHVTFLVVDTHVDLLVLHSPLEKPFTHDKRYSSSSRCVVSNQKALGLGVPTKWDVFGQRSLVKI